MPSEIKSVSLDRSYWLKWKAKYPAEASQFSKTVKYMLRVCFPIDLPAEDVRRKQKIAREISDLTDELRKLELKREELQSFLDFLNEMEEKK